MGPVQRLRRRPRPPFVMPVQCSPARSQAIVPITSLRSSAESKATRNQRRRSPVQLREVQSGQGKYFSNRIAPATSAMMTMFMMPVMTSTSFSPWGIPTRSQATGRVEPHPATRVGEGKAVHRAESGDD